MRRIRFSAKQVTQKNILYYLSANITENNILR